MKLSEVKAIKFSVIMDLLKSGKTVKIDDGFLWIAKGRHYTDNRYYIFYHHFGESATRVTMRNLKWIVNTIFGKKNKDFDFMAIQEAGIWK